MRCNPRREPTVDDWQAERVAQIGLDADRRRDEHRSEGAAAIARIKGRGESIASIAATQALGGEQAEEHGGRSAPIGDAGASTRPWCERGAGRLAQARVAAESTERARRLVGWRGSSRRCGSREHRCAAQDCRCRVSGRPSRVSARASSVGVVRSVDEAGAGLWVDPAVHAAESAS